MYCFLASKFFLIAHSESSFGTNGRMRKSLIQEILKENFLLKISPKEKFCFRTNERNHSFFQNEFKKIFDSSFGTNERYRKFSKRISF